MVIKNLNPLPHDKILGLPKLKAFADDKLNVTQNVKIVFYRIENIVGKEENAGYQVWIAQSSLARVNTALERLVINIFYNTLALACITCTWQNLGDL